MNPLRDKIELLESEISQLQAAPDVDPKDIIADIHLFCADCPLKDQMDCNACSLNEWYIHKGV